MMSKSMFLVIALLLASMAIAQEPKPPAATSTAVTENNLVEKAPVITEEKLPTGSRLYVAPMPNGFDTYVVAALEKKKVPIVVVMDRAKADFELSGVSDTDKAGWAKMLFLGSQASNEASSIKIVNLKTGNVVFAYSVHKTNSYKGKQSAGEAVAKHINEKIENRYH